MAISKYTKALELACLVDDFNYSFDQQGYMEKIRTPDEAGREATRLLLAKRLMTGDVMDIIEDLKTISENNDETFVKEESKGIYEELMQFAGVKEKDYV